MNLYLDSSALVKLYIAEDHRDEVLRARSEARVMMTSRVAWPEMRAALARRNREGFLSTNALRTILSDLERDFSRLFVLDVNAEVGSLAGELAERRALRGMDAIHLASVLRLQAEIEAPVHFLCFDARLRDAARAEGIET